MRACGADRGAAPAYAIEALKHLSIDDCLDAIARLPLTPSLAECPPFLGGGLPDIATVLLAKGSSGLAALVKGTTSQPLQ